MLFRGVAYPFLRDLGWPRAAFWGTAIAFGLIHANRSVLVPLTAVPRFQVACGLP